jgi:hypothetical protein
MGRLASDSRVTVTERAVVNPVGVARRRAAVLRGCYGSTPPRFSRQSTHGGATDDTWSAVRVVAPSAFSERPTTREAAVVDKSCVDAPDPWPRLGGASALPRESGPEATSDPSLLRVQSLVRRAKSRMQAGPGCLRHGEPIGRASPRRPCVRRGSGGYIEAYRFGKEGIAPIELGVLTPQRLRPRKNGVDTAWARSR